MGGGGHARENLTPITKDLVKSSIVLQKGGRPCPPSSEALLNSYMSMISFLTENGLGISL